MLKYVDAKVVFAEVPDEVTLAINISGCPCNCKGCHSSYLAEDIGEPLDIWVGFGTTPLDILIRKNVGITCVAFMGGDSEPKAVNNCAKYIKDKYPNLLTAWYSGRQELSKDINLKYFDYIKLGPYKEKFGPLNSRTTNQRMYKVHNGELEDITSKFWK